MSTMVTLPSHRQVGPPPKRSPFGPVLVRCDADNTVIWIMGLRS